MDCFFSCSVTGDCLPYSPRHKPRGGGESIKGDGFRCFQQCSAMADCLLNPALPRNVRDSRDISEQGKEVLSAASLCGGGDEHPDLPCLQSDSDCGNMDAGKLNCGDDMFGGNPRTHCSGVLTHNGDTIGRGMGKCKCFFQFIFSGANWNCSN